MCPAAPGMRHAGTLTVVGIASIICWLEHQLWILIFKLLYWLQLLVSSIHCYLTL